MKKVLLATAVFSGAVLALEVTGAGSTFVFPIMSKWAFEYNKETGHKVNYQSIGSGGGIRQAINRTVDFGATDGPLTPEEAEKNKLLQFPAVIGADVITYNVPEIGKTVLNMDQKAVCDIYMGKITKWNDPYLQQLNPNVKLPDRSIVVVHRSDGSGTTWIFTNWLSKVCYPITGAVFVLIPKDQPERAKKANTFFKWVFEKGDKYAQELQYIPMPENVKKLVFEYWKGHGVAP
jgi:phosphate transport system substrate-binding protein